MVTENLSTLKIHRLTQAQYDREKSAGRLDENALYLTPDEQEEVRKDNLTLGVASDGLIYIFVDGQPVGAGISQGTGGDLFGYVDENNTIVLNGNLTDGTYNVKYLMEDGGTVDIGNLALSTAPTYTNLFDPSKATINKRVNSSYALTDATGHITSAFIDVSGKNFTSSTKIYVKGATFDNNSSGSSWAKLMTYMTQPSSGYSGAYSSINGNAMTQVDEGNGVVSISGLSANFASGVNYMVLVLKVSDTTLTTADIQNIVVTIDEPIS